MMVAGFFIIDLPVVLLQSHFTESSSLHIKIICKNVFSHEFRKFAKNNLVASESTGPRPQLFKRWIALSTG